MGSTMRKRAQQKQDPCYVLCEINTFDGKEFALKSKSGSVWFAGRERKGIGVVVSARRSLEWCRSKNEGIRIDLPDKARKRTQFNST
jgi:hypothetical protein